MAIISVLQEDREQPQHHAEASPSSASKTVRFSSTLDSSPSSGIALKFLDDRESDFLRKETAKKEIAELVEAPGMKKEEEEAKKKKKAEVLKTGVGVPNRGNGLDLEKYSWSWTQTLQEVTVNIPVPTGTKGRFVVWEIKKNHLKVGLKGEPSIIDGELFQSVKLADCYWSIVDQCSLSILLTKHNQMEWWKSLVKGGPEIDTQKVEHENRKLSDLDPETWQPVEKVYQRKRKSKQFLEQEFWAPKTPTKPIKYVRNGKMYPKQQSWAPETPVKPMVYVRKQGSRNSIDLNKSTCSQDSGDSSKGPCEFALAQEPMIEDSSSELTCLAPSRGVLSSGESNNCLHCDVLVASQESATGAVDTMFFPASYSQIGNNAKEPDSQSLPSHDPLTNCPESHVPQYDLLDHGKGSSENAVYHSEEDDSKRVSASLNCTPEKSNAKKKSNMSFDLNKKSRQTPKRKKYMPKVFEDCKPKRTPKPKTPKPATPKRVISKRNQKGERKYVRRNNLSVTLSEDTSLTSYCAPNSCRRVLNFEIGSRDETAIASPYHNNALDEPSGLNFPKEWRKKKRMIRRRKAKISNTLLWEKFVNDMSNFATTSSPFVFKMRKKRSQGLTKRRKLLANWWSEFDNARRRSNPLENEESLLIAISKGPHEILQQENQEPLPIPKSKGPHEVLPQENHEPLPIAKSKGPHEVLKQENKEPLLIAKSKGPHEVLHQQNEEPLLIAKLKGPHEVLHQENEETLLIAKSKGPHEVLHQENEDEEGPHKVLHQRIINSLIQKFKCIDISKGCNQVHENGHNALVPYKGRFDPTKRDKLPQVELDVETNQYWNLLKDGRAADEEQKEYWEKERKVFGGRVESFLTCMHTMQGNRRFSLWKGSVVDSVVGVFLTQNVSDHLSSSAYMNLAAKFPLHSARNHSSCYESSEIVKTAESQGANRSQPNENRDMEYQNLETAESQGANRSKPNENCVVQNSEIAESQGANRSNSNENHLMEIQRSKTPGKTKAATSKRKRNKVEKDEKENPVDWDSLRKTYWSGKPISSDHMDSVDWEAVRRAKVSEVASAIQARGQHNIIAERIQEFLNGVVEVHGRLDLEWLRDVPPQDSKRYLLAIKGLGLKSVECVRLLTLRHVAFPVDTNVARIAVRLGWVPLKPLPEGVQIHLLEKYPLMDPIQKYLWPRLCHLDQQTLYELHYQMITFGKVFCTKRNPNCNACPMRGGCKHFASAYASAKLALPGPSEKSTVSTMTVENQAVAKPTPFPLHGAYQLKELEYEEESCEPIIEFPASPECREPEWDIEDIISEPERDIEDIISEPERDIEDIICDDCDEIPTIKLHNEQKNFVANLQGGDFSKALVALSWQAASIPRPKLKTVSRLRTEHQVYELPDSHPLLEGLDRREPDDPCSYLLALWTPGETAAEKRCNSQESGELCNEQTCCCNNFQEQNPNTVRGTILIPCRTAMRGRFALNGTYFQINEVFADDESSHRPIEAPREWIWNLPRRIVYFGTSVSAIFRGLSDGVIARGFRTGYICVRGFDQKSRAPRPLLIRFHLSTSAQQQKQVKSNRTQSGQPKSGDDK